MTEYVVRYRKWSRSYADVFMTVEADDPQAAYDRVLAIQTGEDDPTPEEDDSEKWGKEELDDSGFEVMSNPTDRYAVSTISDSGEHESCHEWFVGREADAPVDSDCATCAASVETRNHPCDECGTMDWELGE